MVDVLTFLEDNLFGTIVRETKEKRLGIWHLEGKAQS